MFTTRTDIMKIAYKDFVLILRYDAKLAKAKQTRIIDSLPITWYSVFYSRAALTNKIDNFPTTEQEFNTIVDNAYYLAEQLLPQIYLNFPSFNESNITSWYRSEELNTLLANTLSTQVAVKSDHLTGSAVDIDFCSNNLSSCQTNKELFFDSNIRGLNFKQLIWEYGNELNPDWVHISILKNNAKREVLYAKKNQDGSTTFTKEDNKYKGITNASDLTTFNKESLYNRFFTISNDIVVSNRGKFLQCVYTYLEFANNKKIGLDYYNTKNQTKLIEFSVLKANRGILKYLINNAVRKEQLLNDYDNIVFQATKNYTASNTVKADNFINNFFANSNTEKGVDILIKSTLDIMKDVYENVFIKLELIDPICFCYLLDCYVSLGEIDSSITFNKFKPLSALLGFGINTDGGWLNYYLYNNPIVDFKDINVEYKVYFSNYFIKN